MGGVLPFHVLAAGDAPSPTVSYRVLFTYFQTGGLALLADGSLIAVAALYLWGVARLGKKGREWPAWASAAFLGGLFCIFVGVGSGLAAYDDINFSMHMVQHLFMMMIGAPLMALGRPITLLSQASSRKVQVRVVRIVNHKALQWVAGPIAWVLYYGTMWVYFVTPLYRLSESHQLLHDGLHVWFIFVGYLFWQGIIGLDPAHRVSHALRLGGLFLGMPLEAFLALAIMSLSKPIAPNLTVAGTHNGGSVFWITSMLVMAVAIAVAVAQWISSEERKANRYVAEMDRRAALEPELNAAEEAQLRALIAPSRPVRR